MKHIFNRAVIGLAVVLGMQGCAVQGLPRQGLTVDDSVQNGNVALNPCEREGIKVRYVPEVSQGELMRREISGEGHYQYRSYYLFSPRSVVETWGPLAGALVGGLLTNRIGTGGVVSAAASVSGAFAGGAAGDVLSTNSRLERMARESGCEHYLDSLADGGRQRPSGGRTTYPAVDSGYYYNMRGYNYNRGWLLPPPRFNPFN